MKKDEIYYLLINMTTAMNKLGISISELARLLGVSSDTISRWLRGVQRPSADNMLKVHSFIHLVLDLNLTYDELQDLCDLTEDMCSVLEHDCPCDISKPALFSQMLDVLTMLVTSYIDAV